MSINELSESLDTIARQALLEAKALVPCPVHRDTMIRRGDDEAERRAYAFATNMLKRHGEVEWRSDLMAAVHQELVMAADGECPECVKYIND